MVSCSGFSFGFWRVCQILIVIPIMGMLAYFVDAYTKLGALTPNSILVLFIVSTLASAWTVGTLFLYSQARHSANFVAFVDLLFVGAFIGGIYELRGIADADCTSFVSEPYFRDLGVLAVYGNKWSLQINKNCAMLKASFALAIIACIMFFISCLLALMVHHHWSDRDRRVVRETHYSRHGHRSHRSRSPRHSYHSSRRSYV